MATGTHSVAHIRLRLRPLRFAFLVQPSSEDQILKAIQINTCLWGGRFNAILPYYTRLPLTRHRAGQAPVSARDYVRGYLEAFDPDFVIPLTDSAPKGIGYDKERILEQGDLLSPAAPHEAKYGIPATLLYRHLYKKEFRFVRRDPFRVIIPKVSDRSLALFTAARFGNFPDQAGLEVFKKSYTRAFDAKEEQIAPQKLFGDNKGRTEVPLSMGSWDITRSLPSGLEETIIFLFDASAPTDVLDFWNLRAFGCSVVPVPKQCAGEMANDCATLVRQVYRPYENNVAIMRHALLMGSRSTTMDEVRAFGNTLQVQEPDAWEQLSYPDFYAQDSRWAGEPMRSELRQAEVSLQVPVNDNCIEFELPAPEFVDQYQSKVSATAGWANVLTVYAESGDANIASLLPPGSTCFGGTWRVLAGEYIRVNREGIVLVRGWMGRSHRMSLPSGTEVIADWLEQQRYKAEVSSAGKITREVVRSLGGIHRAYHLADEGILRLLNDMAHGSAVEEGQGGDTSSSKGKTRANTVTRGTLFGVLLKRYHNDKNFAGERLEQLVSLGVVRVGLHIQCPQCAQHTWFGLDSLSEKLNCERCLNEFGFPSTNPEELAQWRYRAVGPFSIENYAQGSYCTVLALHALAKISPYGMTWSPSLNLTPTRGAAIECDFAAVCASRAYEPRHITLVLGECKTFDRFEAKDLSRARALARAFPGAAIAFCTMRKALEPAEIKRIASLASSGRETLSGGERRNPVIILTETELTSLSWPPDNIKDPSSPYFKFHKVLHYSPDLSDVAQFTQNIYLGMDLYDDWDRKRFQKTLARKKAKASKETQVTSPTDQATRGDTA
jgi:hypothetical protein